MDIRGVEVLTGAVSRRTEQPAVLLLDDTIRGVHTHCTKAATRDLVSDNIYSVYSSRVRPTTSCTAPNPHHSALPATGAIPPVWSQPYWEQAWRCGSPLRSHKSGSQSAEPVPGHPTAGRPD